jgi:ribosomal protein S3
MRIASLQAPWRSRRSSVRYLAIVTSFLAYFPISAAYGVLRFVMESGAKGCEVVISGKLRAARAKSMKFTDGFMIHSGQPARDYVDYAVRHVMLRQGVLGIKVKMYVAMLLLAFECCQAKSLHNNVA